MKNSDTPIQLYKHQADLLDRNPARYGIFHSTGVGKTITGIYLANKNCSSVLVIVPKTNKQDWINNMSTHCLCNEWTVLTKEEFKRDASKLRPYDGVIVDEAHHFFGIKSQMSKALMAYFKKHNTKYRWIMTATPYLSTPLNIYVAGKLLGHEWNYAYFVNQFFYRINMGGRLITKPKPGMEDELAKLVKAIGETVDMGALVTVPEQTYLTHYLQLMPAQLEAIDALDEPVFISRWTKKHQIENGIAVDVSGDSGTRHLINSKSDWILKNIKDKNKVAIFCRYKEQIAQYKAIISFAYPDRPIFELHGDVKDRYSMIHAAEAAPQAVCIIQSECSAGYELPSFDYIIFASLSFSYVSHRQAQGRFLRINRLKENTFIYLVTEGVDTDVYNCIMAKQDFSFNLYK